MCEACLACGANVCDVGRWIGREHLVKLGIDRNKLPMLLLLRQRIAQKTQKVLFGPVPLTDLRDGRPDAPEAPAPAPAPAPDKSGIECERCGEPASAEEMRVFEGDYVLCPKCHGLLVSLGAKAKRCVEARE